MLRGLELIISHKVIDRVVCTQLFVAENSLVHRIINAVFNCGIYVSISFLIEFGVLIILLLYSLSNLAVRGG